VEEIVVLPPGAPSWKKGIRTIRNSRGPRDTYG
jgi:predicted nucleic acid-binding Zn ribbon protein